MKKFLTRKGTALAMTLGAAAVVMAPTTAAQGYQWTQCNGPQTACGVFYDQQHKFDITDKACDGRYVYLLFQYNGQTTRFENHNGCNTTRTYGPVAGMVAGTTVLWDTCTEINNLPDACGGYEGAYVN